jgi:hypothetical protein
MDRQGFGLLVFREYGLFVELFEDGEMGQLFHGDLEMRQTSTPSSSLSTGTCYVARVGFP